MPTWVQTRDEVRPRYWALWRCGGTQTADATGRYQALPVGRELRMLRNHLGQHIGIEAIHSKDHHARPRISGGHFAFDRHCWHQKHR